MLAFPTTVVVRLTQQLTTLCPFATVYAHSIVGLEHRVVYHRLYFTIKKWLTLTAPRPAIHISY